MAAFAVAAMATIEREQHAQCYDRLSDIARRRTTTVRKLLISLWRRERDSDTARDFEMSNLRPTACLSCHDCHVCWGALHHIARWGVLQTLKMPTRSW